MVSTEHNCCASHPLIDHANFESEPRPWQRALLMRLPRQRNTVPREPASRRIRRSWDEVDHHADQGSRIGALVLHGGSS